MSTTKSVYWMRIFVNISVFFNLDVSLRFQSSESIFRWAEEIFLVDSGRLGVNWGHLKFSRSIPDSAAFLIRAKYLSAKMQISQLSSLNHCSYLIICLFTYFYFSLGSNKNSIKFPSNVYSMSSKNIEQRRPLHSYANKFVLRNFFFSSLCFVKFSAFMCDKWWQLKS